MRASLPLLLPLASCAALPSSLPPLQQGAPSSKATLYYGQRELDEDDYEPVEEQEVIGVGFSFAPAGPGFGVEAAYFMGEDDDDVGGIDVESSTDELAAGVRYTFGQDRFRPYVGFGLSWIEIEAKASGGGASVSEDDDSIGLWVAGGFDAWITRHVALGLEYRMLAGTDVELFGVDSDADYGQIAITASLGF